MPEPFDLASTLESGQVFRWSRLDEGWYGGTVGHQAFLLRQMESGLSFRCAGEAAEVARRRLHSYFRLEDDLGAIYREVGQGPGIAEAVVRHRGLRLLRQDPWECLVSFVCSAVSNIPRISRTLHAVARRYGEPATLAGQRMDTFPTPERLAGASEESLRGLGLGFRARYVAQIATRVTEGGVDLDGLRQTSYQEARATLLALPGIGEKVAECVLLFSLDKTEGFPVDRWVRRGMQEWYFLGQRMSDAALRGWAQERWGWYAGYVQQYLFHDRRLAGTGINEGSEMAGRRYPNGTCCMS